MEFDEIGIDAAAAIIQDTDGRIDVTRAYLLARLAVKAYLGTVWRFVGDELNGEEADLMEDGQPYLLIKGDEIGLGYWDGILGAWAMPARVYKENVEWYAPLRVLISQEFLK